MGNNENSDPNAYLWAEGARLIADPAEKSVSDQPAESAEGSVKGTYDRDRTLEAYENWHALRTVIGHREEECAGTDPIDSDDWYTSDRDGIEIAHDLAAMLKPGDACGCKDVDIEQSEVDDTYTYTVQCVHCPNRWTVRDGEVVQVRAWADGRGNWHAAVTEQGMGHAASAQADALAAITRALVERGVELDAIQARMEVEQVARTSEHGKLETEFVETWKHPEA